MMMMNVLEMGYGGLLTLSLVGILMPSKCLRISELAMAEMAFESVVVAFTWYGLIRWRLFVGTGFCQWEAE